MITRTCEGMLCWNSTQNCLVVSVWRACEDTHKPRIKLMRSSWSELALNLIGGCYSSIVTPSSTMKEFTLDATKFELETLATKDFVLPNALIKPTNKDTTKYINYFHTRCKCTTLLKLQHWMSRGVRLENMWGCF